VSTTLGAGEGRRQEEANPRAANPLNGSGGKVGEDQSSAMENEEPKQRPVKKAFRWPKK